MCPGCSLISWLRISISPSFCPTLFLPFPTPARTLVCTSKAGSVFLSKMNAMLLKCMLLAVDSFFPASVVWNEELRNILIGVTNTSCNFICFLFWEIKMISTCLIFMKTIRISNTLIPSFSWSWYGFTNLSQNCWSWWLLFWYKYTLDVILLHVCFVRPPQKITARNKNTVSSLSIE